MKIKSLFILLAIAFWSPAKAQKIEPRLKAIKEMPMFKGCEALSEEYGKNPSKLERKNKSYCSIMEMVKFINANLEYPVEEQTRKIEGDVLVSFNINEEGLISNPRVVNGISPGLDQEALRIVNLMPVFIPAKNINGDPVKSTMSVPVEFRL